MAIIIGKIIKRDLIMCPKCKLEQLAVVIEQGKDALFFHECRLCEHEIGEKDWKVVIDDFDNQQ